MISLHLYERRDNFFRILLMLAALFAAGCNSPYPSSVEHANILYTTFSAEPKHLDPAQSYSSDEYQFICQILEPPFQYHFLKRPYQLAPLTATAIPKLEQRDVQWQGKTIRATVYTIRLKRGILYQSHPCFVGENRRLTDKDVRDVREASDIERVGTRELVAADYVYAIRRLADPRLACPIFGTLAENILGLREYADDLRHALDEKRQHRKEAAGPLYSQERDEKYNPIRLDYAAYTFPGCREIDSHTFEVVLLHPYPQILYWMTLPFFAPVPPEAVEFFSQRVMLERAIVFDKNPVGTGPYTLSVFEPASLIVLERNPNFHEERYPDLPRPAKYDRQGQALYKKLEAAGMLDDVGKRLPMIDRIEFRMEKEWIPRWNKFLQGYYDTSGISSDLFDQAVALTSTGDAVLSDRMGALGMRLFTAPAPSIYYFAFNMNDPVIGGYTDEKRKLRRAISITFDVEEQISIFSNGRGVAAHSPIPPGIFGYEEGEAGINPFVYRWDKRRSRPQRRSLEEAKQLLAEAGYPDGYDRNGEQLTIRFDNAWVSSSLRPRLQFTAKQFAKLGIRLDVQTTDYNRFRDKVSAGNFQMVSWGWNADYPDPENFLFLLYGPNSKVKTGGANYSNYSNPEYDRLFVEMRSMPNTPERLAILRKMNRILQEDAPWIFGVAPVSFALIHSWYKNAFPHAMANNSFKYKRINVEERARLRKEWNRPRWGPVIAILAFVVIISVPALWAGVRQFKEA